MTNKIIDAKVRFSERAASKSVHPEDLEAQQAERSARQQREAAELRDKLKNTPRLDVDDRQVIVRNLGRAIERKKGKNSRQTIKALFVDLYGEEGAISKEKKRKRYIRLDGEPINDHRTGEEYAANGPEFLRIITGLGKMLSPDLPVSTAEDEMLLVVCDGASFHNNSRPRLLHGQSLYRSFKGLMDRILDRVARETDIVEYFENLQDHSIETWLDDSDVSQADEYLQIPPVAKFSYSPKDSSDTYLSDLSDSRRLVGLDINASEVPRTYPSVRLAKVYWPRQVLCLPAYVETKALEEIRTRSLSKAEVAEAIAENKEQLLHSQKNQTEEESKATSIKLWRKAREFSMWQDAIRDIGLDPATIDWRAFESAASCRGLHGAKWRTFWQSITIDLHIVAESTPDALRFGLSFWKADDERDVFGDGQYLGEFIKPSDDNGLGSGDDNLMISDEVGKSPAWFPDGDRTYVSRGLVRYIPHDDESWDGVTLISFTDMPDYICKQDVFGAGDSCSVLSPPPMRELQRKLLLPIEDEAVWDFINLTMKSWKSKTYSFGRQYPDEKAEPRLRPTFHSPDEWTPAPDGSIISAIMRSFAYGEGEQRLDEKIISEVNNLVRCYQDMKEGLSDRFEAALAKQGNTDMPSDEG